MLGTIKTFLPEKQYGFIKGDDGKDYYFRYESFANPDHRQCLCQDALVDFEPTATPKGYRARTCVFIDSSAVTTFVVPDDFPTSRSDSINGWEIVEMGRWIVHGSSRDSPDSAKRDLLDSAVRVRANALINVTYYKTTGSEAGTGKGIHHFTIHNFSARIVTVARRSPKGAYREEDLHGLNQRAECEMDQLILLKRHQQRKKLIIRSVVVGVCALLTIPLASKGDPPVFLLAGLAYLFLDVYTTSQEQPLDYWLQRG